MTEKIGFPDYIMDPAELDKDYEGVGDHFIFYISKYLSVCKPVYIFKSPLGYDAIYIDLFNIK